MLPQGGRVTCYPGAPVSYVIPGRACHMLPWAARYSTSDGKGTSNLKRKMGPRPKFERAQVLQRYAAWVCRLSLGAEAENSKNCCSPARSRRLWKKCSAALAARHPSCEVSSPSSGTAMSTASGVSSGTARRRISRRTICNARARISSSLSRTRA